MEQANVEAMIWVTETVDSAVGAGTWNSLALGDDGLPHISYISNQSGSGTSLMYAYFDSTEWITETVERRDKVRCTSLPLDGDGYPHISYHDGDNDDLRYAYLDASGWHSRTVKSTGDVGDYNSLDVDADGHPHISYQNDGGDLSYAYFNGSVWTFKTVDSHNAGQSGLGTSLKVDSDGRPHISHVDVDLYNTALKYSYFDGLDWVTEELSTFYKLGWATSLALDAADNPYILYKDDQFNELENVYSDGENWFQHTLDNTGYYGIYTSLSWALDSAGSPQISYYDSNLFYSPGSDNLMYAYIDGAQWITMTLDSAGDVGMYNSIALDSDDRLHISYYDNSNGDLKYASLRPASTPTPTPTSKPTVTPTATQLPPGSSFEIYLPSIIR